MTVHIHMVILVLMLQADNSRGQQTSGHDGFQTNANSTTAFFDIHPSGTAALLKQVSGSNYLLCINVQTYSGAKIIGSLASASITLTY